MAKQEDKRVIKTKALIRRAYLECIEELGIKRTTVKEVCNRAFVSRKAFYSHYETIDFLFNEIMDECFSFQELRSSITIHELQLKYFYVDYPRYLSEVIAQFKRICQEISTKGDVLRIFLKLHDPWFDQYFDNRCSRAYLPEPPSDDMRLYLAWELIAKEKCVFARFSLMHPEVDCEIVATLMAQTVNTYIHLLYTNSEFFTRFYELPKRETDFRSITTTIEF